MCHPAVTLAAVLVTEARDPTCLLLLGAVKKCHDLLAWWCHTQASACNMPDYMLALLQAESSSCEAFNTWISRSSCLHIQLLLSQPPAMRLLAIRSSQAPASPSVAGVCGGRLLNQQHQAQGDWTRPRHQQTRTSGAAPSATSVANPPSLANARPCGAQHSRLKPPQATGSDWATWQLPDTVASSA
jgi:hypothetical protein